MIMAYRPRQRVVKVRALTDAGWLTGDMSAPPKRSLADSLAQAPNMLAMVDAKLPDHEFSLPFFSVRTHAVHLIMLEQAEKMAETSGAFVRATPQEVVVLIGDSTVSGTAMVPQNLRVSDYFTRQKGFVSLSRATLRVRESANRQAVLPQCPEILINTERMVGVAETTRK